MNFTMKVQERTSMGQGARRVTVKRRGGHEWPPTGLFATISIALATGVADYYTPDRRLAIRGAFGPLWGQATYLLDPPAPRRG